LFPLFVSLPAGAGSQKGKYKNKGNEEINKTRHHRLLKLISGENETARKSRFEFPLPEAVFIVAYPQSSKLPAKLIFAKKHRSSFVVSVPLLSALVTIKFTVGQMTQVAAMRPAKHASGAEVSRKAVRRPSRPTGKQV
jgi:hypothetical protein